MADPKMSLLLRQLHARTLEGKISWQQTVDEGAFQVSFTDYAVRISRQPTRYPHEAPDAEDIALEIFNEKGELIEQVDDTNFRKEDFNDVYPFKFMSDLHAMARRNAMGVDKAVSRLLLELSDEE